MDTEQYEILDNLKKQLRKTPLNSTSAFGDFPSTHFNNKENLKTQKLKKSSDFRIYYDRGDIPIRVYHSGSLNKIKWNIAIDAIKYEQVLPDVCRYQRNEQDAVVSGLTALE